MISPLKLIIFVLSLSLSAACWSQEPISAKQLKELRETIDALKQELKNAQKSRDKTQKILESTEKNIGELSKKAKRLKNELKANKKKLDGLKQERIQLNEKKTSQQHIIGEHINAAYRLGQLSKIRLILDQQDPTEVSRNSEYFRYFIEARAEKIVEYRATLAQINAITPKITQRATQIEEQHKTLKKQQTKLQQNQQQRQQLLATLNTRIANKDQRLKTLLENHQRLQKLFAQISQSVNDIKLPFHERNFSKLKGKLPWPAKGKVLQRFGSTRVANRMKWDGLLIASKPGNPVKAVHHGRVVFSDYLRGHGLLIIVDHGSEFMSLYAHNQSLFKTLGEWVDTGEQIATVGSSGGQKQSALYFELRHKGKPTNPQTWFSRV
ncbi:MAG: ATPase [Alteromonadaceae bacterium]|nr:MAG: ATPase [Alteromonadaceae bacterium]